jgi:hypothetical protein
MQHSQYGKYLISSVTERRIGPELPQNRAQSICRQAVLLVKTARLNPRPWSWLEIWFTTSPEPT